VRTLYPALFCPMRPAVFYPACGTGPEFYLYDTNLLARRFVFCVLVIFFKKFSYSQVQHRTAATKRERAKRERERPKRERAKWEQERAKLEAHRTAAQLGLAIAWCVVIASYGIYARYRAFPLTLCAFPLRSAPIPTDLRSVPRSRFPLQASRRGGVGGVSALRRVARRRPYFSRRVNYLDCLLTVSLLLHVVGACAAPRVRTQSTPCEYSEHPMGVLRVPLLRAVDACAAGWLPRPAWPGLSTQSTPL
jgi:hypothetical protein